MSDEIASEMSGRTSRRCSSMATAMIQTDEVVTRHVARIVELAPHEPRNRSLWLEGYWDALVLAVGVHDAGRIMQEARKALATRPSTRFDR